MTQKGTRLGMVIVSMIWLTEIYIISAFGKGIEFTPMLLIALALATVRVARLLSFNEIAEFIRAPFTFLKQDSCKAGMNVHPRTENSFLYTVGSLLACPICTGTHAATLLLAVLDFVPRFGIYLTYALAIAGASELLHWWTEHQEWASRTQRCTSGLISPDEE